MSEWMTEDVPLCFCGRRAYFTVGREKICTRHKDQLQAAIVAEWQMSRAEIEKEWRGALCEKERSRG